MIDYAISSIGVT